MRLLLNKLILLLSICTISYAQVAITGLPELDEAPASADVVPIVDIDAGVTKKITTTNFFAGIVGLDISSQTNLAVSAPVTQTGDTIGFDLTNATFLEALSDAAGGMFSSNTETGITVTYQDTDNTIDLVVTHTESSSDTLTNKTINTASNTITVVEADISDLAHTTDTTLSQEQVEDYVGAVVGTGGTKTGITITYQDGTNDIDFVVGGLTANELATDSVSADELNATGVESELEAVLDHNDLQGITATDHHADSILESELTSEADLETQIGVAITVPTEIDTFSELDTIVADETLARVLFHADDCTSLTDGREGDICWEQDQNRFFICEPSAGLCDTPGEWTQDTDSTGAGGGIDSVEEDNSEVVSSAQTLDFAAGFGVADGGSGEAEITLVESELETILAALNLGTSVTVPLVVIGTSDPADSGVIRLENNTNLAWEAATPGTDLTLGVDTNDELTSSVAFNAPSVTATDTSAAGYVQMNELGSTNFFRWTVVDSLSGDLSLRLPNDQSPSAGDVMLFGAPSGSISDVTFGDLSSIGGTIGDTQIAAGAVDGGSGGEIADGSITVDDMAANSVDSAQYVDGSIDTAHFADNNVTRDKVEAELRTHVVSFSIDPTVAASGEAQFRWGYPITLTEIRCDTDAGTVATVNMEERAPTTPNSAGTDTLTSDLTCDTNEEIGTTFTNAGVDAWDPVALTYGTVTTATILRVHVEFTID